MGLEKVATVLGEVHETLTSEVVGNLLLEIERHLELDSSWGGASYVEDIIEGVRNFLDE